MLDQDTSSSDEPTTTAAEPAGADAEAAPPAARKTAKKAAAKKTATKAASKTAAKKTTAKRATKKAATESASSPAEAGAAAEAPLEAPAPAEAGDGATPGEDAAPARKTAKKAATKSTAKKTATKKAAAKKTTKKAAAAAPAAGEDAAPTDSGDAAVTGSVSEDAGSDAAAAPVPLFQAPAAPPRRKRTTKKAAAAPDGADETQTASAGADAATDSATADTAAEDGPAKPARASRTRKKAAAPQADGSDEAAEAVGAAEPTGGAGEDEDQDDEGGEGSGNGRRRRRRGGRRRRRSGGGGDSADQNEGSDASDQQGSSDETGPGEGDTGDAEGSGGSSSSRRRRRRRRSGEDGDSSGDDPANTTTRVRKARSPEDEITALSGSTRLEAKKQRRREGREAGRRRAPIVSEAEFLARREAVDRVMVIRQRKDLTQIAVMEDKVLVEHYVARESQTSLIGNVYLGRVQNVLPSMEAAFVDIGKGRNAVLYAGEVNWDALGAGNGPRKIEQVLKSGQPVLVQVTKDPVGHKGARLTSQISLPGRFLVYVPDGTTSGISRKLPDTERNRLKTLLKEIVPDTAGVIVRTAAEGASEEELTRDVERLTARWEDIAKKAEKGNAPQLLYGEPDLTLKVVRDLFTEDFRRLVVSGDDAWDMVESYVGHLAPDLAERLERWDGDTDGENGEDVFAAYRIDEQIAKALDRKVWLPSGGSLIIDRTEAMTVVDVNTGKFTGSGGNLEETVTKNNLEAAEEIVRQLRLRDIGGIIVVDFIDMVLESNRDLVLRRLVECLGRDRTRHQVAEVTSLGLVQMTRKRIGTGLLEAFSESCEHCQGRGLVVHHEPIEPRKPKQEDEPRRGRRSRGGRGKDESSGSGAPASTAPTPGSASGGVPSPKELAAMAKAASAKPSGAPEEQEPAAAQEPATAETEQVEPSTTEAQAETEQAEPEKTDMAEQSGPPETARDTDATSPEATALDDAPAEPVVRTSRRSRRGSSRRPAGPPSAESGAPAVVVPEVAPAPAAAPEPAEAPEPTAPEAAETSEAPAGDGAEPPAAPRVVTSSRRRVARRPAGPPAGGTATADGAGGGADSNGAADTSAPEEEAQLETAGTAAHVPVKRKGGGRKR